MAETFTLNFLDNMGYTAEQIKRALETLLPGCIVLIEEVDLEERNDMLAALRGVVDDSEWETTDYGEGWYLVGWDSIEAAKNIIAKAEGAGSIPDEEPTPDQLKEWGLDHDWTYNQPC